MRDAQDAYLGQFNAELERQLPRLLRMFARQAAILFSRWGRPLDADRLSDVVAELVCAVVQAGKNYDPSHPAGLVAWANGVAANRLRDRQRELAREVGHRLMPAGSPLDAQNLLAAVADALTESPPDRAERDERAAAIHRELDRLPAPEREAIRLRFFEYVDYTTLADRLGRTEAAVRGLVCRGVARLGKALGTAHFSGPSDEYSR